MTSQSCDNATTSLPSGTYRHEVDASEDVGLVVLDGAGHGLADSLQGRDVDDAVDVILKL